MSIANAARPSPYHAPGPGPVPLGGRGRSSQPSASIHRALAAAVLSGRDERFDQSTLGIGEVAQVAQARALMGLPLLHAPQIPSGWLG